MYLGRFISLEGIDGSGKSSNVKFIADYLRFHGFKVIETRDPGGTELGEKLRQEVRGSNASPLTESLLYMAVRQQLADELIIPSLKEGYVVISDRYCDSTFAYQGYARGLMDFVSLMEPIIGQGLKPDYTLLLDLTVEESISRCTTNRGNEPDDRFDKLGIDFKQKIYDAYQIRAQREPGRIIRIDASGDLSQVQSRIQHWLDNMFIRHNEHLATNTTKRGCPVTIE